MRRVREILRYRFEDGLGHKAISFRVGAAPSTVRETLRRAAAAELTWPLGDEISDAVLEAALYRAAGTKTGHRRSAEPDWAYVHRELKRKHVTLQILWDEYIARHPDGYRYSRFCDLYRGWAASLPVTMRQNHAAGDKLFVDYAGDTVTVVVDRLTGKTRQAHLFVAVLGASSPVLCGGALERDAGGLDRLPCACAGGIRRRAGAVRSRQCEGRGDQGLPLRPAGQSQLRRDGGAL